MQEMNAKTISYSFSKPALSFVLALTLLINCMVPRFVLSENAQKTISIIFQTQSTLIAYFSLTVLPMKLVNVFMGTAKINTHENNSIPSKTESRDDTLGYTAISVTKDLKTNFISSFSVQDRNVLELYILSSLLGLVALLCKYRLREGIIFRAVTKYLILSPRSALPSAAFILNKNILLPSPVL